MNTNKHETWMPTDAARFPAQSTTLDSHFRLMNQPASFHYVIGVHSCLFVVS
jgi:hypothetical protein